MFKYATVAQVIISIALSFVLSGTSEPKPKVEDDMLFKVENKALSLQVSTRLLRFRPATKPQPHLGGRRACFSSTRRLAPLEAPGNMAGCIVQLLKYSDDAHIRRYSLALADGLA